MARRSRAAALVGLLLALSAAAAAADALDDVLGKLGSNDGAVRTAAESQLSDLAGPQLLPRLVAYYPTCPIVACYSVVRVVETRIPGKASSDALRRMTASRTDYGGVYAAMALQRLGDDWGRDHVLGKVKSPQTPAAERLLLVNYLSSFGPQGQQLLVQLARDAAQPADLRARCLERLSYATPIGNEEQGLAESLKGLTAPPDLVQSADLYRYSRGEDEPAARLDQQALAGQLGMSQCYQYVNMIERRKDKARKAVLVHFGERGSSTSLQAQALRALNTLGHAEDAVRLARRHQDAADSYLKRTARELLAGSAGGTSAEDLKQQLTKGSVRDRVEAAELLLGRDDASGAELILEALAGKDLEGRRAAARAIAALLDRRALVPLVEAMNDADTEVRLSALGSFKTLSTRLLPYRQLDWGKVGYPETAAGEASVRAAAVERLRKWVEAALAQ